MVKTRDPFGQALAALRRALDDGFAPGQHLPIIDIAGALGLSTSPVREALSRLCGEGHLLDCRGLGYFTRTLPTEDLVGLFQLEKAHVRLAMELCAAGPPPSPRRSEVEPWIDALLVDCTNEPLKESFDRVSGRLAPIRRLRPELPAGDGAGDAVDRYYGAWIAEAPALATHLRRLEPAPGEYTLKTV